LLIWLLSATLAGFIVQQACAIWLHHSDFERFIGLSPAFLEGGNLWAIFTYPLVHRGVLHLLAVALPVYFLGRELVPHFGERRLCWLALIAVILSGATWVGVHFGRSDDLFGGSPILWCFLASYACLLPNKEISFLVFFVVPVTLRPKNVAWSLLAFDLAGFFFTELPGNGFHGLDLPHSAHLAAMLVGWLGAERLKRVTWLNQKTRTELEAPRWMKRPKKVAAVPPAATATSQVAVSREDVRAEVDRILDKINSEGFGSLSLDEKRALDEAKDLLSRP
jgi:membrane associated rhomboid family serine protease